VPNNPLKLHTFSPESVHRSTLI